MEKSKKEHNKLILTGGGTRGIYQIGAMKALDEQELLKDVNSISATSIGAVNAGLYLSDYSVDDIKEFWDTFTREKLLKNVNPNSKYHAFQMIKETFFQKGIDISRFRQLLDYYIKEEEIRDSGTELVITAYNQTKKKLEYRCLANIPEGKLVDYILASARLPFFKPVVIDGHSYLDGGVADNEPHFSYLDERHFDLLITIKTVVIKKYLLGQVKDNISYDDKLVIKPTEGPGMPLSFDKDELERRYQMGYEDAQQVVDNSASV